MTNPSRYYIIDSEDTKFIIKYIGNDKFLIIFTTNNERHDWLVEASDLEVFMIHNLSKFCVTYKDARHYLTMVHIIIEDYGLDE